MKQRLGNWPGLAAGQPRLLDPGTARGQRDGSRGHRHQVLLVPFRARKTSQSCHFRLQPSHVRIQEFFDSVFVINRGHLVASGDVKELLKPHERIVRATFVAWFPTAISYPRHRRTVSRNLEWRDGGHLGNHAGAGRFRLAEPMSAPSRFSVSAIAPKQKTLKEFSLSITGLTTRRRHHQRETSAMNPKSEIRKKPEIRNRNPNSATLKKCC